MNVCVTGGAGYIGSHMVRVLRRAGHSVVVVDDLSAGHADAVPKDVPLVACDVRDREKVSRAFVEHRVEAVLHFASRIQVGESVTNPRLYWRDNMSAAVELLATVLDAGIKRFVLSSTAAVYGDPIRTPIDEEHPTVPVNPYGQTKLAIEKMLGDYAHAYGLSFAALRYFNASGADVGDRTSPATGRGPHQDDGPPIGERHEPETHLIPIVLEAALGKRPHVTVFGDDWATPDGTCVRDYIHVLDLADAHLAALEFLTRSPAGTSGAFNLGTGHGCSVRQVIDACERASGRKVPVVMGARRAGDPPVLVASADRAARVLGWKAKRASIDEIVRDAFAWHSRG